MRFFHLSDLHIGLKLMNKDLRADQEEVFSQIVTYAAKEQPDAILIAGDVYDRSVPSAEAVELFDRLIGDLLKAAPKTTVMVISGNHDSAQRINLYRDLLSEVRLYMVGQPPRTPDEHICQVVLQDEEGPVSFYLLPFVKPSTVREITGLTPEGNLPSYHEAVACLLSREAVDASRRNVLVSHQFYLPRDVRAEEVERMDSEVFRTVGNIDEVHAEVLEAFDYAALGHIHKPMKVGAEQFRYCGTPLPCSVSEAGQEKGILSVTLGKKGEVSVDVLPLVPRHPIRIVRGSAREVCVAPSDDYVRIELTDQEELEALDLMDRLYAAYPNLLEVRRVNLRTFRQKEVQEEEAELSPLGLCEAFLEEVPEAETQALLVHIMNEIQEEGQ